MPLVMSRVNRFDYDSGYDYSWDATPGPDERDYAIYSVAEDGVPVARALVNTKPLLLVGYTAPPELLTTELDYFEVHKSHRGRGVGGRVTQALTAAHGRLHALSSPDAVGFYRSIGWSEYLHESGRSLSQAELFVGP